MQEICVSSFPVRIYIAGNRADAERGCRKYCQVGLCVTVTPTEYIYKNGQESGVIVGLINYPRFPASPDRIKEQAISLAKLLMEELCQSSATIETPLETIWITNREDGKSPSTGS